MGAVKKWRLIPIVGGILALIKHRALLFSLGRDDKYVLAISMNFVAAGSEALLARSEALLAGSEAHPA